MHTFSLLAAVINIALYNTIGELVGHLRVSKVGQFGAARHESDESVLRTSRKKVVGRRRGRSSSGSVGIEPRKRGGVPRVAAVREKVRQRWRGER